MTKLEMRALCERAVRENPHLIRRFPMRVCGSSARGMALLGRDPRTRATLDARRGAGRRMDARQVRAR